MTPNLEYITKCRVSGSKKEFDPCCSISRSSANPMRVR